MHSILWPSKPPHGRPAGGWAPCRNCTQQSPCQLTLWLNPPPPPSTTILAAEKSLAEYRDRLPQNVIDEINGAVADLRGVMESENPEASLVGFGSIEGRMLVVCRAAGSAGMCCGATGSGKLEWLCLRAMNRHCGCCLPWCSAQAASLCWLANSPPPPSHPPYLQDIKAKINGVQQAVMKIGSSLSGQASSGGSEDVQDAEVKDKKE